MDGTSPSRLCPVRELFILGKKCKRRKLLINGDSVDMLEVKPLGGVAVDSETAKLFIGVQHLEPDACINYLLSQITNPEAVLNLEEFYIDLLRLTTVFDYLGFITGYNLGCGSIHLLEELLGTDIIVCQDFLREMVIKLTTVRETPIVPGFSPLQRTEVLFELQGSIASVVGYLRYLLETME